MTEETLMDALVKYLTLCRDSLADIIQNFDLSNLKAPTYSADDSLQRLENELEKIKKELKTLITQKVKELTTNPGMAEIINETYASLQTEKMERISAIEKTLQDLTKEPCQRVTAKGKIFNQSVHQGFFCHQMGMFTKLLSLFVVGAAHIIFPTVRAVDCSQLHAAVLTVQTPGTS